MKGKLLWVWMLLFAAVQLHAQPADSLLTDSLPPRVYPTQELYDLALLDTIIWQTRFAQGPMKLYNPLQADLSQLNLRMHPSLKSKMLPRQRQSDAYFALLFAVLASLALLINRNRQYARNMWQALFNLRLSLQFAREQAAHRTLISLIYLGLFNLLLALFLAEWVAGRLSGNQLGTLLVTVLLLFLSVTLLYLFKYYFYKLLGSLFGLREQASFYLSEVFLINRLLVFLLLPALAALYFVPWNMSPQVRTSILVLLGLGMAWRYFNAIRFFRNGVTAHVFHFILYFCAVEIIPTAVIAKFLLHV